MQREGFVRVEGALSEAMLLTDMVFQGTVLGPALWNAFFADVAAHVPEGDQQINSFADDLTATTAKDQGVNDDIVMEELREIQTRAHSWGARNQVEFDASKESMKILHPSRGSGDDFRLLGTIFDVKLRRKMDKKTNWKCTQTHPRTFASSSIWPKEQCVTNSFEFVFRALGARQN